MMKLSPSLFMYVAHIFIKVNEQEPFNGGSCSFFYCYFFPYF